MTDRLLLLDRRVAALRKARPDLRAALDVQELLIRTALETARPAQAEPFALPREAALARVRDGVPLLHEQPVVLDLNFAADLFSRLVNALAARQDIDSELAQRLDLLVTAATSGQLNPEQLFGEAFVDHADHLAAMAASLGVDAELLTTLAHHAVAPIVRAYAERLTPVLERAEADNWRRGYCPICGAWPLLGELRGVELALWLRCTLCGSGWRWQRLVCPYCGNDDHHTLGSLVPEGENRFRLSVCERCKGYLKVGNAFDPPPAEFLPLEDVASLHLDIAAIERGYQRPGGSGYRIEIAIPEGEWLEELA